MIRIPTQHVRHFDFDFLVCPQTTRNCESISFQRLSLLLNWEFVTAKITCADRSWEAEAPWWPFSSQKWARAWRPVKCIKSVNGIFRCAWPKASWAEENYT